MNQKNINIFIVDDEIRIRRMLRDYLSSLGYNILEASDGEEALSLFYANNSRIDLILLDVMMPKKDGYEVLREIRQYSNLPIIMLTARTEEYDQIDYLKHGADDFVGKPFSPALLAAHIESVLRRTCINQEDKIQVGELLILLNERQIIVQGMITDMTPKEYDLLLYFVQNIGIALSRENILDAVWNYDYTGDLRTVDTHVKQLRAKLSENCPYIKTIHSVGYRFEV